jgi:hypothetical protein
MEAIIKVIFGIRGSGKTVKLRRLTLDSHRLLLINTLNRDGFTNGIIFTDLTELKKFWKNVYTKNFRIIYSPVHGDIDKACDEVGQLSELAMLCGNMTLAIEEMNVLFEGMRTPRQFNRLVFAGREPGVELVGVAQTPVGFGSAMRSMTKEAFIFHCHERSHLDIFEKLIGKEARSKLPLLKNYEYLHWSMNEPEKYQIKKDEPLPYMP